MNLHVIGSTGYYNTFFTQSNFLNLSRALPAKDGNFVISKISSETAELDKFFTYLSNNNEYLLPIYCKLINVEKPAKWTEDNVIYIVTIALMTKTAQMINRDILNKFPENKQMEFYDFMTENKPCTDDGRLFWQVFWNKWDIMVTCESRNRYKE